MAQPQAFELQVQAVEVVARQTKPASLIPKRSGSRKRPHPGDGPAREHAILKTASDAHRPHRSAVKVPVIQDHCFAFAVIKRFHVLDVSRSGDDAWVRRMPGPGTTRQRPRGARIQAVYAEATGGSSSAKIPAVLRRDGDSGNCSLFRALERVG